MRLADDVSVRKARAARRRYLPFRLLRLTDSGVAHVGRWATADGDVIGADVGARALARRLLDDGLLLGVTTDKPIPDAGLDVQADLDVIVPVHERHEQLDQCLARTSGVRNECHRR